MSMLGFLKFRASQKWTSLTKTGALQNWPNFVENLEGGRYGRDGKRSGCHCRFFLWISSVLWSLDGAGLYSGVGEGGGI